MLIICDMDQHSMFNIRIKWRKSCLSGVNITLLTPKKKSAKAK